MLLTPRPPLALKSGRAFLLSSSRARPLPHGPASQLAAGSRRMRCTRRAVGAALSSCVLGPMLCGGDAAQGIGTLRNGLLGGSSVSERLQSWLDVDGTAFGLDSGTAVLLGSGAPEAGGWWKLDGMCQLTSERESLSSPLRTGL